MFTLSIFLIVVGLLLAIFIGINLSSNIDDVVLYFLFWLMYIITIFTFVAIGSAVYFYSVVRNKKGPDGARGPRGDKGKTGLAGNCNKNCGESLCYDTIVEEIVKILDKNEINNGGFKLSSFKNVYLKSKIKSICGSPEFTEYAKSGGSANLINYLKQIWAEMTQLIYDSGGGSENGGIIYFKTIGAENTWNWLENNPFDEFKKYDIYYWGLGKDYQPRIEEDCDADINKEDAYDKPDTSNQKYSINTFLKVPNIDFNVDKNKVNQSRTATTHNEEDVIKIYDAYNFTNDADVNRKYVGNKKAQRVNVGSVLVGKFGSDKTCLAYSGEGNVRSKICDKYDKEQQFKYEYLKNNPNNFKLKHIMTDKYLANDNKVNQYGSLYKYPIKRSRRGRGNTRSRRNI